MSVKGRVDSTSAGELETALKKLLDDGKSNLVLDLSGVEFLSSSGLRVLVTTLKAVRKTGGDLRLAQSSHPAAQPAPGARTGEIVDRAPAFDPTRYPIDPSATLRDARVGGRGLLMIRRIMDDISYERRGRQNLLRLTKNRSFTGA